MIEKTIFTNDKIKEVLAKEYNLDIVKIEHEDRGSSNIFYVYEKENKKYVLKEFESRCTEKKILKEAEIISFVKNRGINVPNYIKTKDDRYCTKYNDRIIILMDYIDGYIKEPNSGTYEQTIESAELFGKLTKILEDFEVIENIDIEEWCSKSQLEKAHIKYAQLIQKLGDNDIELKIKSDFEYKIKLLDRLSTFDFSVLKNLTMKNCHGDFSIMQFLYKNEKIEAVLDFERAKYIPVIWEIIRSYTSIDKSCKDGDFCVNNFIDYVKVVRKYIDLNIYDMKYMPYIYLIKLAISTYGYKEYMDDNEQVGLLNYGFWRTKMCKSVERMLSEYNNKVVKIR